MTMHADFPAGSVWLVGAGPGDPELLTRKAERMIRAADIVFHDALVSKAVLALVPPDVERVSVGKRAGRHSAPQPLICASVVKAALSGQRVVRLKGGDPSIFGRATEEIEACRDAGVTVQVCAGMPRALHRSNRFTPSPLSRPCTAGERTTEQRGGELQVSNQGWGSKRLVTRPSVGPRSV